VRSVKELYVDALGLRKRLRIQGKDPLTGLFNVTAGEKTLLLTEAVGSPYSQAMSLERDRLCGVKLNVTDEESEVVYARPRG
jgi:hypothetical protein